MNGNHVVTENANTNRIEMMCCCQMACMTIFNANMVFFSYAYRCIAQHTTESAYFCGGCHMHWTAVFFVIKTVAAETREHNIRNKNTPAFDFQVKNIL